jgi:hypothetical protein
MARTENKICDFEGCKNPKKVKSRFCSSHYKKATANLFLSKLYSKMYDRVSGRDKYKTRGSKYYLGLPILPRDVFYNWAKNHPDFLALYKRWVTSEFDRRLAPSVNRMNSDKGYVLGNIEWVTNSQNCGLSSEVRKMKNRKAIYDLLGVTNGKK